MTGVPAAASQQGHHVSELTVRFALMDVRQAAIRLVDAAAVIDGRYPKFAQQLHEQGDELASRTLDYLSGAARDA